MSLPFQREQIGEVVKRITKHEAAAVPWTSEERRAAPRVSYLRANVSMQVRHPSGQDGGTYLLTRNISSGGIAAWHRSFLYPGSVCVVELFALEGAAMTLVADLKGCRHIEGHLHESNISFREKVEIGDLLSLSELAAMEPEADPEPEAPAVNLSGMRVLVTACDEGISGLVRAALEPAGCVVVDIESLSAAFDELRTTRFDAVVCGDLVVGAERATMLLRLRTNARFHGHAVLAGFRQSVASGLIAGDPDKKCVACDPFDAESVVAAMPRRRKAA